MDQTHYIITNFPLEIEEQRHGVSLESSVSTTGIHSLVEELLRPLLTILAPSAAVRLRQDTCSSVMQHVFFTICQLETEFNVRVQQKQPRQK